MKRGENLKVIKVKIDVKRLKKAMFISEIPTYKELAKLSGISYETFVRNIAKGNEISYLTAKKIADCLSISVLDIAAKDASEASEKLQLKVASIPTDEDFFSDASLKQFIIEKVTDLDDSRDLKSIYHFVMSLEATRQ